MSIDRSFAKIIAKKREIEREYDRLFVASAREHGPAFAGEREQKAKDLLSAVRANPDDRAGLTLDYFLDLHALDRGKG